MRMERERFPVTLRAPVHQRHLLQRQLASTAAMLVRVSVVYVFKELAHTRIQPATANAAPPPLNVKQTGTVLWLACATPLQANAAAILGPVAPTAHTSTLSQ